MSVDSTVVWGASLPFEQMYPALTRSADTIDSGIYGLGVFTFAPFSVPTADERDGKGMIVRLLSEQGVPIIATLGHLALLKTYCLERHKAVLVVSDASPDNNFAINRASCHRAVSDKS